MPAVEDATLQDSRAAVTLNARGQVISLRHLRTGTELLRTRQPTGWTMITTLGEWIEHPIFDRDNHGRLVRLSDEQVNVQFDELVGMEGTRLPIGLTLSFRIADGEIHAAATIDNRSDETVTELWFPFVSGFQQIDAQLPDALTMPLQMGRIIRDPRNTLPRRRHGWWCVPPGGSFYAPRGMRSHCPMTYPGVASMAWIDFHNQRQGIYFGSHAQDLHNTALLARGRDGEEGFQVGFARYPFVKPGEQWRSPTFVLMPHLGDWHAGARRYRHFAGALFDRLDRPQWTRDLAGVHQVSMKHQNGHRFRTYRDLVELFRADRHAGRDLPLLVFSWFRAGHDSGYPIYEPDPGMGGETGLREALRTIGNEGGRVILYTQGRLMDMAGDYFRSGAGRSACAKNRQGVPYYEEWSFLEEGTIYPNKLFALGCPATTAWQQQLHKQLEMVMDLGASGILFDQIGATSSLLCFDPEHPHATPDAAFGEKARLLEDLQAHAAQRDPEFVVIGEHICDAFVQQLDFTHGVATAPDPGDPPDDQVDIALYRYTHPTHRVTTRAYRSRWQFNYGFVHGLMFELPDQASAFRGMGDANLVYLTELCRLRQRLGRFLARGRFVDVEGLKAQPLDVVAKAFDSEDARERAIVVWNPADCAVEVTLDVANRTGQWHFIRPGESDPAAMRTPPDQSIRCKIAADSVVVVIVTNQQ